MSEREIHRRYHDPIELIWRRAAERLGLRVERSSDVFASYDGEGLLTIASGEHFDPDDSLAQMILHEICHALVAGPGAERQVDWGLSNADDSDLTSEHACHRVQAALAGPHGLREFMAVTTNWRSYYDALPVDPLKSGDDPAIALAQQAYERSQRAPYHKPLQDAFAATARIADAVRGHVADGSLWSTTRARHSVGFLLSEDPQRRCGDCAWAYESGSHLTLRCRQAKKPGQQGSRVGAEEHACERWEPSFDSAECGGCGACCREGFDTVTMGQRDPFRRLHPELVQLKTIGYQLPRPGGRCVALDGDGESSLFRCRFYADRPKSCAQFPVAGDSCLIARRRVGLSR